MEGRVLPPWDALPWFDLPVETLIHNPAAGQLVAPADPRRVILIIGTTGQAAGFSTVPNATSTQGLFVSTAQPFVVLTQQQHGSLAQVAWYNGGAALINDVTIIEVKLKGWPK